MKKRKLLSTRLSGTGNVRVRDAAAGAKAFGFRPDRVNGSHPIFVHSPIPALLILQDLKGKAKPYRIERMPQLAEIHTLPFADER
jgi:predicted RNA binding protein YcfA (HicA-like mRNA interferase family)